ncbi:unnamed protein product, partial [Scytosiphon promiscuus]
QPSSESATTSVARGVGVGVGVGEDDGSSGSISSSNRSVPGKSQAATSPTSGITPSTAATVAAVPLESSPIEDTESVQEDGELKGPPETSSPASGGVRDRESSGAVALFQLLATDEGNGHMISGGDTTSAGAASPIAERVDGGRYAPPTGQQRFPCTDQRQQEPGDECLSEGTAMSALMAMSAHWGGGNSNGSGSGDGDGAGSSSGAAASAVAASVSTMTPLFQLQRRQPSSESAKTSVTRGAGVGVGGDEG